MLHRPEYIEVKAPAGFSLSSVRKIVLQKSPWILKKLEGLAGSVPRTLSRNYSPGELFYYLGSAMTLNIRRDAENLQVAMNENMITVSVHGDVREQAIRDHVKKQLLAWYREHAFRVIGDRVRFFSDVLDIPVPDFRVRNIRKRWGSCTADNHLSFNIRLVMAPKNQIDYVVLHEMCHIFHKDHQEEFWNAVGRYMPDYPVRRALLKREGWQYVL